MKTKKYKQRYRKSVLYFCYLTGVLDHLFKRNKGEVEDSAFIAKRIAAFTDCIATAMKALEESTEESRSEAQILMSSLDDEISVNGKSMGQKRARKAIDHKKAQLIKLDGSMRIEIVKAMESLIPYMEALKAQTVAYSHGFKKPIADSLLMAMFSIEQNSAYISYQDSTVIIDNAIHLKALDFAKIKEEKKDA